jgi:hypothetical protein
MTNDEIIIPSSSIFASPSLSNPAGGGALHQDLAELQEVAMQLASAELNSTAHGELGVPGRFSWQTIEGRVMKRWQWDERKQTAVEREWMTLLNRAARLGEGFDGTDAFVAFGFGG